MPICTGQGYAEVVEQCNVCIPKGPGMSYFLSCDAEHGTLASFVDYFYYTGNCMGAADTSGGYNTGFGGCVPIGGMSSQRNTLALVGSVTTAGDVVVTPDAPVLITDGITIPTLTAAANPALVDVTQWHFTAVFATTQGPQLSADLSYTGASWDLQAAITTYLSATLTSGNMLTGTASCTLTQTVNWSGPNRPSTILFSLKAQDVPVISVGSMCTTQWDGSSRITISGTHLDWDTQAYKMALDVPVLTPGGGGGAVTDSTLRIVIGDTTRFTAHTSALLDFNLYDLPLATIDGYLRSVMDTRHRAIQASFVPSSDPINGSPLLPPVTVAYTADCCISAYPTTAQLSAAPYDSGLARDMLLYAYVSYCGCGYLYDTWNCAVCQSVPALTAVTSVCDIDADGFAYVGKKSTTAIVVAFRGSNFHRYENLVTDINIVKTTLPSTYCAASANARVHTGFWNLFNLLLPDVEAALRLLLPQMSTPTPTVFITGHSLGAAMATLFALHVAKHGILSSPAAQIVLHTFGEPEVGNCAFVQCFQAAVANRYRVTNAGDTVPGLVDAFANGFSDLYHQWGPTVWYDHSQWSGSPLSCVLSDGRQSCFRATQLAAQAIQIPVLIQPAVCSTSNSLCQNLLHKNVADHVHYWDVQTLGDACPGTCGPQCPLGAFCSPGVAMENGGPKCWCPCWVISGGQCVPSPRLADTSHCEHYVPQLPFTIYMQHQTAGTLDLQSFITDLSQQLGVPSSQLTVESQQFGSVIVSLLLTANLTEAFASSYQPYGDHSITVVTYNETGNGTDISVDWGNSTGSDLAALLAQVVQVRDVLIASMQNGTLLNGGATFLEFKASGDVYFLGDAANSTVNCTGRTSTSDCRALNRTSCAVLALHGDLDLLSSSTTGCGRCYDGYFAIVNDTCCVSDPQQTACPVSTTVIDPSTSSSSSSGDSSPTSSSSDYRGDDASAAAQWQIESVCHLIISGFVAFLLSSGVLD